MPADSLLLMRYLAAFPVVVIAEDVGEQAPPTGIWETVITEPDVYAFVTAQALADATLAKRLTAFKYVTYPTTKRLLPGQTQTITVPSRNLSGTFLVTDVETSDTAANRFAYQVKAVGGTTIPGTWRDMYRQWGSGGAAGPVSAAGIPAPSGSTTVLSSPFFLGGSRNTSVAPSPAAWLPVPNYVPYTATASFGGRVRAQLFSRNAGVSASCRLYNVTDAVAVATSSAVTSQTATEVTFLVSITAGKTYRLEVSSGTSGEGVFCLGVLEST
jgi:hypothetical protein